MMEVRLIVMALICLFIAQVAFAAEHTYPFASSQIEQRFIKLTKELRCAACQNQSLFESNASVAKDMREQIYQMLQDEQSDQSIREFMTSRYGEIIWFNPPKQIKTLVLWAGPFIMLGIASIYFMRQIVFGRH